MTFHLDSRGRPRGMTHADPQVLAYVIPSRPDRPEDPAPVVMRGGSVRLFPSAGEALAFADGLEAGAGLAGALLRARPQSSRLPGPLVRDLLTPGELRAREEGLRLPIPAGGEA